MKLVVGLGNPGRKYDGTRHNVGWEVIAELARRHATSSVRVKYQGEVVEAVIGGEKVLLLCPHTYMNLSGQSVQPAKDFYKLENEELLVICDDMNLPVGTIRVRRGGSAGGQKGLKNIIDRLGANEVPRMRLGIGLPPNDGWNAADYVLGKFTRDEREEIDLVVQKAADAVEVWTCDGIQSCMNQFN